MTKKQRPKSSNKNGKKLWRREKRASVMLPYARQVDETTIATRDGAHLSRVEMRPSRPPKQA